MESYIIANFHPQPDAIQVSKIFREHRKSYQNPIDETDCIYATVNQVWVCCRRCEFDPPAGISLTQYRTSGIDAAS
jgi:hypothetical protein